MPASARTAPAKLIGIFGGYRQDRSEIDLVLILDEPRAALEKPGIERLFRALGRMKRFGVAIIYISPRLHLPSPR